jgi:hypothetical protein
MGSTRSAPPAALDLLLAREAQPAPRLRRSDDTIVPASSLSAMPLAWAVGPVASQQQFAAIAGKAAAKKQKSPAPSPECVFCMKGAATAQGFRPAYWFYERQPAEVSPTPAGSRAAKIKTRRGST